MNPFIQFLIVFDLICFGVYFGGDIFCTALAKMRKNPDQKDPYEFEVEDEPAEPPLSIDAIRHLFRGEVHDFVRNKLLPSGQETLFRPDRAGADGGPVPVLRPDWLSQRGSPDG